MAWSRSGDPRDAYRAYLALHACANAQRDDLARSRTQAGSQATCGDITPGQLTEQASLLDRAALAGVRGAVWSYLAGGTDGAGTVPMGTADEMRDPAVAEYFAKARQYQQAAADNGDRVAMMGVSFYAENTERDVSKALAYWVAQEDMEAGRASARQGIGTPAVVSLGARLTAEEASLATQRGHDIAARAVARTCDACGAPEAAPFAQEDMARKVREQLALAPSDWSAQNTFAPNDTMTVCVAQACRAVAYQATGLWIAAPGSARREGH